MAHHWSEGVSSLRFTAREFQLELIDEALRHNLLTCPPSSAAFFVTLKLIQELAHQIRRPSKLKTVILVPLHQVKAITLEFSHLTDLCTIGISTLQDCLEFKYDLHEVLVCTSEILENMFKKQLFSIENINLLVIEQCHMIVQDNCLKKIMSRYCNINQGKSLTSFLPRILAFTYPLFTPYMNEGSGKITLKAESILKEFDGEIPFNNSAIFDEEQATNNEKDVQLECLKTFNEFDNNIECLEMNSFRYWQTPSDTVIFDTNISDNKKDKTEKKKEDLTISVKDNSARDIVEYRLDQLETFLNCKTDMAADIVGLKRITGRPKEIIIECEIMSEENKSVDRIKLENYMKNVIAGALLFINDHRYDPTEIYGDDEELKSIPDPCTDPRQMLELILYMLHEVGAYAADKAAFTLLTKIEKLKIKIPYERHFLLLCLVSSVLIQIRSAAELIFEKYTSDKEKIINFSTPKVLRLLDILRLYKPIETSQKISANMDSNEKNHKEHSLLKTNNRSIVQYSNDLIISSKNNKLDTLKPNEKKKFKTNVDVNGEINILSENNLEIDFCKCNLRDHDPALKKDICNRCKKNINFKKNINCRKTDTAEIEKTEHFKSNLAKVDSGNHVSNTSCRNKELNIHASLKHIEECDFKLLEIKIEQNCKNIIGSSIKVEEEKVLGSENVKKSTEKNSSKIEEKKDSKTIKGNANQEKLGKLSDSVKLNVKDSPSRKLDGAHRGKGRGRGGKGYSYINRYNNNNDPDALCGLIFVDEPLIAKILPSIINEYCRNDDDLKFVCAQYTIDKVADPLTDIKEAEIEHKLQEEVLKRFRVHECNLLVGTSFLEEGMDLPKCNLVVKWDIPSGYRSHARCRARARAPRSLYVLMAPPPPEPLITTLAHYVYIERMLVKKCGWREPPASEEAEATKFSPLIEAYRPSETAVNLTSAVALLNRYCAKLPSDTFTRLVPLWTMEQLLYRNTTLYICTIRLPINCPLKHLIVGHPMPNRVLARRIAALQACKALHMAGELDDNLMPIGKEGFRAMESDWLSLPPASDLPKCNNSATKPEQMENPQSELALFEPRPGTTKRKQYYYKKIAKALTNCRPVVGQPCLAYQINAWLACPLPEKHNTRGRKLHPPEAYTEGFAILTSKPLQKIPVFPIFTRSGEVRVALQQLCGTIVISRRREKLIHHFMKYTFAEVLRVHNHLMLFDEEGVQSRNSYYIVPTTRDNSTSSVKIDWNFLQLIYEQTRSAILPVNESINKFINSVENHENTSDTDELENDVNDSKTVMITENKDKNLVNPFLLPDEVFVFDNEKFRDAVVMPWYRNQDQPQYFYVAEICSDLSPCSAFPSAQHATFEEYYRHKYNIKITQLKQPLLDVDHTSARLNLLTPRFVNRKGVALPTSSERTKKAKRESLEQKQILVPELCYTHPFRGALWRAAVALPCVLYRINSLLLADEIRKSVALCVALGNPNPKKDFEWPALDFGWSLAEVLLGETNKDNQEIKNTCEENEISTSEAKIEIAPPLIEKDDNEKTANDILKEKEDAESCNNGDIFEIGTWSNEMAANVTIDSDINCDEDDDALISATTKLPGNLTICTSIGGGADWNLAADDVPSPRHSNTHTNRERRYSTADSIISYASCDFDDSEYSSILSSSDGDEYDSVNLTDLYSEKEGIRIEFKSGNEAEAIEIKQSSNIVKKDSNVSMDTKMEKELEEKSFDVFKTFFYGENYEDSNINKHVNEIQKCISMNEQILKKNGILVKPDQNLDYLKPHNLSGSKNNFDQGIKNNELSKDESRPKITKKDVKGDDCEEIYKINTDLEIFVEEDNVNPFPETYEIALSKNELIALYNEIIPYQKLSYNTEDWYDSGILKNGTISLENLEMHKKKILQEIKTSMPDEEWKKINFFSMKDHDIKVEDVSMESDLLNNNDFNVNGKFKFSFDYQPDLRNHPGPSPSLILQALTMSNANDGINLERLETIGDSFLKYAITTYLYCTYQNIHEGKLSHLRSKQVSNLNLYRLGRRKSLGSRMVAYKFEPHDNWLPPCHRVPPHLERALIDTHIPSSLWNIADMPPLTGLSKEEVEKIVREKVAQYHVIPNKMNEYFNNIVVNKNCLLHGRKNYDSEQVSEVTCSCNYEQNYFTNLKNCEIEDEPNEGEYVELAGVPCFVPYNLITQHSIPDKSVADCVEALIGAYLIECGPRGALLFMAWLGIRVLPKEEIVVSSDHPFVKMMENAELSKNKKQKQSDLSNAVIIDGPVDRDDIDDEKKDFCKKNDGKSEIELDPYDTQEENSDFDEDDSWNWKSRIPGSLKPEKRENGEWVQILYGELKPPPSPLLRYVPDPEGELMQMLSGYEGLEKTLNYRFKDRCYLLQAMTHASYSPNRLTDCYQRLEFLGDAVLDYLITRQLYEDPRRHSPGALTDLRSALVNNTIFASLAVRHGMHKYFRHLSPGLSEVLARFVKIQEENGHSISEDHYLIQEDECEQVEDVEVPKALGDLFESIAGAIFLDSGMSLDTVWNVYYALMQREIDAFSESVPKSPVRELLEMEPETAKFGKPEKLADGRRVRVTVEVLGVGVFKGVGRNYRIAKCTAAKCALRRLGSSSNRRHKK